MNLSNTKVNIPCPNCKTVTPIDNLFSDRIVMQRVTEYGLICPECGHFTHAYYMIPELEDKRVRLEVLRNLWEANKSGGRWLTYDSARKAYTAEFDQVQKVIERKLRAEKVR